MPDQENRNRRRKKGKTEHEDSEEEEEEEIDERVLYFVPAQDIDIEVLVYYLRRYLGDDSHAEPGQHPKKKQEMGYYVKSRKGLSSHMMRDLKDDSAKWIAEKRAVPRNQRRIRYEDSKTARTRAEIGASGDPTDPPGRPTRPASVKPEIYAPTPRLPASNTIQRRDSEISGSINYQPMQTSGRTHQDTVQGQNTYQGQNPTPQQWNPNLFSQQEGYAMNYSSQTPLQSRSGPAFNTNILVNTTSYQTNTNRHGSPAAQNVLPALGERMEYSSLAPPPYDGGGKGGNQPPTTGTHGFSSINPTAGARHNKPSEFR